MHGTTGLGVGYLVKKSSPRVQVRESIPRGRWQVTVRAIHGTWAEIVAETKTEDMAEAVKRLLLMSPKAIGSMTPARQHESGKE